MLVVKSATTRKRTIIISIAVVLLLIAGTVTVMAVKNVGPFADSDTASPDTSHADHQDHESRAEDEQNGSDDQTVDELPSDERSPSGEGGDKPVSGGGTSNSDTFTSSIDALEETDSVRFSTIIQKAANSGTCSLTLTSGNKSVHKQAGVQQLGGNATCKGFTVPRSELSAGNWAAQLTVTISGERSSSKTEFSL